MFSAVESKAGRIFEFVLSKQVLELFDASEKEAQSRNG